MIDAKNHTMVRKKNKYFIILRYQQRYNSIVMIKIVNQFNFVIFQTLSILFKYYYCITKLEKQNYEKENDN